MARRPGTPRLLRELNDRAALDLLLSSGPLTRSKIGELTGLSKVTASQLLARLEERGLVEVVGSTEGGRGPNAALYAVVPSSAYVAGLDVGRDTVTAGIADITGRVVAETTVEPGDAEDPVAVVHQSVQKAARRAHVAMSRLRAVVIGTPGVIDPRHGDMRFSFDLPAWHEGVIAALRGDLRRPVTIENDANLAALAERAAGVAAGVDDFVLVWFVLGPGMAVMLGDRLHRGASGGAGEIGWLPVPGAPLPAGVGLPSREPLGASFQSLVGHQAILELASSCGVPGAAVGEVVAAAVGDGPSGGAFLDELARRIAVGVASVAVVLDPELVVLGGQLGGRGGAALSGRVQREVARLCPAQPRVEASTITGNPVLRGALHAAVDQARAGVFTVD
ncbi:MAG TPA: ROK family transcriptional regulator [Streptosporangiaceae bacterium]|jgi:predicted NBD/HSP70 family sugar kinase